MRLIYSSNDQQQAYALSAYLNKEGINNKLELQTERDWGSDDYGIVDAKIWVIDEDHLDRAQIIIDAFKENPNDPKYYNLTIDTASSVSEKPLPPLPPQQDTKQPLGSITFYLLVICSLLWFISTTTAPEVTKIPPYLPSMPVATAPIYKELMYDYPHAYEMVDTLVQKYGLQNLLNSDTLPAGADQEIANFQHTPYWQGLYSKVIAKLQHPDKPVQLDAPMFEKIREGEFWRLFTPALLHSDIFHLFFNMIWLVVIGRQIEMRMTKFRYIIFIILTAVVSNTAQYLVSGSNFIGFSGVLCAMIAYVWVRQVKAPWEGYQIQPGTFGFIAFFILFMVFLQAGAFFAETYGNFILPIGIANTAHLSGALMGYLLGRMNYFSWQQG